MSAAAQLPLDLGHRPAMGAEDFLVANCNRAAVAWLDLWPNWPGPALVLHAPAGAGKTHLTQVWQARSGAISLAVEALQPRSLSNQLSDAAAVAVDDADNVAGDRQAEQALFHLYNLLRERGGHLLLTSSRPVAQWGLALPDLRSRLLAAPAAGIELPDDGLLAAVLVKLFGDRQLRVGMDVVAYLVPRIERSFDAARRVVAELDSAALAERRAVTLPLARAVLDRLPIEESEGEEA